MSANSTPGKPGSKSMSSRLLTMKFMQRAAASSPTASSSVPSTPEGPPTKRRKQDNNQDATAFDVNELANQAKIRAVMEEEAAKQQALMDKVAAEAGESRWVLNFEKNQIGALESTPLKVIHMGYADLDRESRRRDIVEPEEVDDTIFERPILTGRRSFGKFNRVIEKLNNPDANDSSDSSSSEDENSVKPEPESDESSDDDGTSALLKEEKAAALSKLKEERKNQKKNQKKELLKMAEARKKKDVNLNGLTSLSNSGSGGGRKVFDTSKSTCYNCQQVGHLASDCPNKSKPRRSMGDHNDSRSKKARKSY